MDILKKQINNIITIRKELKQVDKNHLWNYDDLPNTGITDAEITLFENTIGFTLPKSYRNFLKEINGWKNFWHSVNLFSISDYSNNELMKYTMDLLEIVDDGKNMLFPIGVTTEDTDLFTIVKPGYEDEGTIIWFAGYEVERYKDFHEFLKEMYILLKEDVIDFKNGIY
ncbi:SMI1/KNR4 family protein [Megamonas funiformis]|uniref:SMI1/KNR4 family protein n=1 Tax=Megamonas funiformis TaxID=437897 RepID=UPI002941F262|nr:SMI1/KNR4 family protein [Megamonas funiformis]